MALLALDAVFLDQGQLLSPVLGEVATTANYLHEFARTQHAGLLGAALLTGPALGVLFGVSYAVRKHPVNTPDFARQRHGRTCSASAVVARALFGPAGALRSAPQTREPGRGLRGRTSPPTVGT